MLRPFFRSYLPNRGYLENGKEAPIGMPLKREIPKTSKTQARADRYLLWLQAYEYGIFDPITRCTRPRSVPEIARLWKTPIRTVRYGIQAAKRLQNQIRAMNERE